MQARLLGALHGHTPAAAPGPRRARPCEVLPSLCWCRQQRSRYPDRQSVCLRLAARLELDEDRQPRQARAVRSVLAKLSGSQVDAAYARPRLPKDAENSLSIVDFRAVDELIVPDLVLHP